MQPYRLVVVGVGALLAVACGGPPVLGVMRPVTGSAWPYGQSVDHGFQLALEDARTAAQLPQAGLELVQVDTGSCPETAAVQFRRLVAQNSVNLVLGGVTPDEAAALAPVAEDERVVCLSPSAMANSSSRYSPYFYRLYPAEEVEGRTAARHLFDRLGIRRLIVYSDDSVFTRTMESEFRQQFQLNLEGEIVGTVHLSDPQWRSRSTDLLHAHHPGAVYVIGYGDGILQVLEHLRETRYQGARCTTSTFYVADVLRRAGEAAEGVTFPLTAFDASSAADPVHGFVERYRGRFGDDPDIFAAHGYDAMRVALHTLAVASALYTPEIRKAMQFDLRDLAGVTGAISFDDHGEVNHYPVMHCVDQGSVISYARLVERKVAEAKHTMESLQGRPAQ